MRLLGARELAFAANHLPRGLTLCDICSTSLLRFIVSEGQRQAKIIEQDGREGRWVGG